MQAIIITQPGAPDVLQLQERLTPQPGNNEVLIKVKAAGINRPDIAQRKGHYPPPPTAPQDIPGLEVAGIIEACGAGVKRWNKGDEVCALLAGGGYATYAIAHETHCLSKPTNLSLIEAAALPETVFTVWHNVFQRGALKPGENFLVHGGSSGIGISAIQLTKAFGAKVFATAGTEEKCNACINAGADRCINYKTEDFEEALKNEGADVILDMIGGDYTPKNIRLLKDGGRLVFINAMKGNEASFNIMDIMRRRLTITGSTLRNRNVEFKAALAAEVEQHVWPLIEANKFRPSIYKTFILRNAAEAHLLMETSSHIGKIVLLADD
jgi:NADPH2:quinone reductase